jgi:hypothetical protein
MDGRLRMQLWLNAFLKFRTATSPPAPADMLNLMLVADVAWV